MTLPKSIALYNDVATVLAALLQAGGGTYTLPDKRAAVRFRSRCNKYRQLLREEIARREGTPEGFTPVTEYDNMYITTDDFLTLKFSFTRPIVGALRGPDGTPITPAQAPPSRQPAAVKDDDFDSLLADAQRLMGGEG